MANFRFFDELSHGRPPLVVEVAVAATQTLVEGDAVYMNSGAATKRSTACGSVMGIMAEDSTLASAGTMVKIYLVTPYQRWRATADADASSALINSKTHDLDANQQVTVSDTTGGSLLIWKALNTAGTDVLVSFTQTDYLVN